MVVGTDLVLFPRYPLPIETAGVTVTREDEDMTAAAAAQNEGAAKAAPMGALSRLVQEVNDTGVTYQEMADRGVDEVTGTQLPRQWYQKLVKTPPVHAPTPEQMKAISKALGRPLRHIQEAVASQWLQYEATELAGYGNEVRIIVGHLAGMPETEKRKWLAMIEAAERARRESGE